LPDPPVQVFVAAMPAPANNDNIRSIVTMVNGKGFFIGRFLRFSVQGSRFRVQATVFS
jgi:hypothetical protein